MKATIRIKYSRWTGKYLWTVKLDKRRIFKRYSSFGYSRTEWQAKRNAELRAKYLYELYKTEKQGPVVETIEL
jgi:hypothetical protein